MQIPNWEYQLYNAEQKNWAGIEKYWQDLKARVTMLLELMSEGVSGSNVPRGWREYKRVLCVGATPFDLWRLDIGVIINIPFHNPTSNWNTHLLDVHEMPTNCGGVYTKTRLVVIVKLHSLHASCVPIYSHKGRGLHGKSDGLKAEYMAVQDTGEDEWTSQNGYRPLKADTSTGGRPLTPMSYVKFTEVVVHRYGNMCGIMGHLDEASAKALSRRMGLGPDKQISKSRGYEL